MANGIGMLVVLEGGDGVGKTTQVKKLFDHVKSRDKYQDVLVTREPTWRANKLREHLENESNPFAHGKRDALLFVEDRMLHYRDQIAPSVAQGVVVICDRFSLSNLVYQSAQGVPLPRLIDMHMEAGILAPDITFHLDVSKEVAAESMAKR